MKVFLLLLLPPTPKLIGVGVHFGYSYPCVIQASLTQTLINPLGTYVSLDFGFRRLNNFDNDVQENQTSFETNNHVPAYKLLKLQMWQQNFLLLSVLLACCFKLYNGLQTSTRTSQWQNRFGRAGLTRNFSSTITTNGEATNSIPDCVGSSSHIFILQ